MAALSGKSALVTGGSRGIGAAIAKRLAKEGADALALASGESNSRAVICAGLLPATGTPNRVSLVHSMG